MAEKVLPMAEVLPSDREAYLAFNSMPPSHAADVRAGRWDHTTGMQIIALHASTARVEALEEAARWLEGSGPDRDNGGPCRHVEHVQGTCSCTELATVIRSLIPEQNRLEGG